MKLWRVHYWRGHYLKREGGSVTLPFGDPVKKADKRSIYSTLRLSRAFPIRWEKLREKSAAVWLCNFKQRIGVKYYQIFVKIQDRGTETHSSIYIVKITWYLNYRKRHWYQITATCQGLNSQKLHKINMKNELECRYFDEFDDFERFCKVKLPHF